MSEGVGNPVYDSFDDGRPLEDVRTTDTRLILPSLNLAIYVFSL